MCQLPWGNLHLLQVADILVVFLTNKLIEYQFFFLHIQSFKDLLKVMGCELLGTFLLCLLPPLIIDNQTLAHNDSSQLSYCDMIVLGLVF